MFLELFIEGRSLEGGVFAGALRLSVLMNVVGKLRESRRGVNQDLITYGPKTVLKCKPNALPELNIAACLHW